jgi:molybdopterin/thiamine biosynthesis adenylyltransferase
MQTERPHPRLIRARALIVGVGGLGAPAATALATAGIGGLGLADPDVVELSNLPRQPLYVTTDVGRPKVTVAAERLRALAPGLHVETWQTRVMSADLPLARAFDVILDGTDTIAAKFAVNDLAVAARVPLVHAGVLGFRAQLLTVLPHASACYRCLFEEAPPPGDVPSCEEAGVLGAVAALAGALQAAEAVRIVCGGDAAFAGRLLAVDLRAGSFRTIPVPPNPRCAVCHPPRVPASGRSDAA